MSVLFKEKIEKRVSRQFDSRGREGEKRRIHSRSVELIQSQKKQRSCVCIGCYVHIQIHPLSLSLSLSLIHTHIF